MSNVIFEILNTYRDPVTDNIRLIYWSATVPGLPSYLGMGSMTVVKDGVNTTPFNQITKAEVVELLRASLPNNIEQVFETSLLAKLATIPKPPTGMSLLEGIPAA